MSVRTPVHERRQPLVVTRDLALLDDLVRLAAAGSADVQVATDAAAARACWGIAPFVLLGVDVAQECARAGLTARASIVLVARESDSDPPWHLAEVLRAKQVAVLPAAEAWLVDRFADQAGGSPSRARVVAVLGGSGGAGASVLATALAVTAQRRGLDTLLIDADPMGGGVDLVLGWERMEGMRWPELVDARGRVNPPALVGALPGEGSLAVLSFDRSGLEDVPIEAMAAALDAGRRGRDLVVLDLPRRMDEASRLALTAADCAYLVVPAELRACAAARRVAANAKSYCPRVSLIVRDPTPGGLPPDEIAEALGLPLTATLRSEHRLLRGLESGNPPAGSGRGPLADTCRLLLTEIRPRRHRPVAR